MSLIVVPEFIIHSTIEMLLLKVREDYSSQTDKTKSLLAKLLDNVSFQRYDFLNQAISVICCDLDHPRYVEVDLLFNRDRNGAPTIHVMLPNETTDMRANGLGNDEGYIESDYEDGDEDSNIPGSFTSTFTRSFQSQYDIVITSDNANEIILIYHLLKALLISATDHFHLSGLRNISIGGQDIQQYAAQQMFPGLYVRSLRLSVQYETTTLNLNSQLMANKIEVQSGIPKLD